MRTRFLLLCIIFGCIVFGCGKTGKTIIYPAPDGEEASTDYSVRINRQPLFIYQARVSAAPVNMGYPGYQRPLEQTELASFGYFDTDETVEVEIESKKNIEKVTIRPLSKNIKPQVTGNKIRFQIKGPCQLAVEINDHHEALFLFVNPVEDQKKEKDQYTYYFGPGRHQPGIIELKDNESIYIEGGAIVETLIKANNAQNISIQGRGMIDASSFERGQGNMIRLNECTNIGIEGVILRDPPSWTLTMSEARNARVNNVKLIGLWRYNADGIDIVNSQNVTVTKSFVRAFDDCIALKGLSRTKHSNLTKIYVDQCVLWCDWGRNLEIGAETVCDSIHHIFFSDIDIIRYQYIALSLQPGDRAELFDIHYEDIRVEDPVCDDYYYFDNRENPVRDLSNIENYEVRKFANPSPYAGGQLVWMNIAKTGYSRDLIDQRGKIYNITYKKIRINSDFSPKSTFMGYDDEYNITDLLFEDIYINGKKVTNMQEANMHVNDYAGKIMFK